MCLITLERLDKLVEETNLAAKMSVTTVTDGRCSYGSKHHYDSNQDGSKLWKNVRMDFGKMCACLKGFSGREEAEMDCNEGKRKTPKCDSKHSKKQLCIKSNFVLNSN